MTARRTGGTFSFPVRTIFTRVDFFLTMVLQYVSVLVAVGRRWLRHHLGWLLEHDAL